MITYEELSLFSKLIGVSSSHLNMQDACNQWVSETLDQILVSKVVTDPYDDDLRNALRNWGQYEREPKSWLEMLPFHAIDPYNSIFHTRSMHYDFLCI